MYRNDDFTLCTTLGNQSTYIIVDEASPVFMTYGYTTSSYMSTLY